MLTSRSAFLFSAFLLFIVACGGGRSSSSSSRLQPVVVRPVTPEITMQHNWYATSDSLYLLLRFEDVRQMIDVKQAAYALEYEVRAGNTIALSDSLGLANQKKDDAPGQLLVKLALPGNLVQAQHVLSMRLWQRMARQERIGAKFSLELKPNMLKKDYLLVMADNSQPLIKNHITTNTKLLLQHYSTQPDSLQEPLQVHFFNTDFAPALPPMSTRQEPAPRTIAVTDTLNFVPNDTIQFGKEGLYLIAADTDHQKGILVQKWSYPLVTMAEEMIQPLIYLTTSEERQTLFNAKNKKAALDNFWLKVADGNRSFAREVIRTFYGRVEDANRQFTSHKAGWATDRGMIYIIYGRPSNVSRVGANEAWIYRESETSPYIKFVFTKKENNFTENHYELIRRREYEESWYSTVAQWRAGITDM